MFPLPKGGQRLALALLATLALLECLARPVAGEDPVWTTNHQPGYCALYGICGHRSDYDVLSCPRNIPAQPLSPAGQQKLQNVCPQLAGEAGLGGGFCCTEEQLDKLQSQIQIASIFLVGCPACNRNFKHFYCLLTCSPDQATFTNVTALQPAADTNATSVAEVDVFMASALGTALFDSCKDVVYPVANQKAMKFVGGGATNYQEWLDFLGLVKDKRFPPTGSPFQMNFPPEAGLPEGMAAANSTIPSCGDPAFACSCGDCPSAPGCEPPPPPPPPAPGGCPALHTSSLTCGDISLLVVYIGVLAVLPLFVRNAAQGVSYARGEADGFEWLHATPSLGPASDHHQQQQQVDEAVEEAFKEGAALGGGGGGEELVEYSATEALLRQWFYRQGVFCTRRPLLVLGASALAVLACALGMLRLSIMTAPEELWVGAGSQAAREKADYEASFGPFYRITQLILTTTLAAQSPYTASSGLPSIVTDAHLRLLFDMQDEIDALAAATEGGKGEAVRLQDVCLKPLGDDCATQSVLQYWKMSREVYEKGSPPLFSPPSPEFCFGHWSTQCLAAFGGPVDPHLVLGGFPTAAGAFRNYTADATAFVVTLPLDSHPDKREAVLAWEAALVELATGRLSEMAAGAGLALSFSTERSVQDELGRESSADAGTVLLSYLAMLCYIAVALGTFPRGPGACWQDFLVHSRAGLGLGGVLVVAASVVGALGVSGWCGLRATLIIAEVIPFLVLAVGVDNMFILAHALADQGAADRRRHRCATPLAHRMGLALAGVGPSITLAAAAEVVAFSMGALTSMPALRSFSLCAALAVVLNYLLQITAFVALLALDTQRLEAGRFDCMPWRRSTARPLYDSDAEEQLLQPPSETQEEEEAAFGPGFATHVPACEERIGVSRLLQRYMAEVHAPLLLRPLSKLVVLALFCGMFLLSCALLPRLERGLDQSVALPRDSYLQRYYSDVMSSLRVGPPLMLVVRGLNVSSDAPDVAAVCSVAGCRKDSLLSQVSAASRAPWSSWLATPAASWLDDFLTWVSPDIPQCCRQFSNGTRCPPPDQLPCSLDPMACQNCTPCFTPADLPSRSRPSLDQFRRALPWFLDSLPSQACAKGGKGAYTDSIQADPSDPSGVAGLSRGVVAASAFRSNYVVLSRQSDFISAMQATRDFAACLSSQLGLDVFSYSVFHIFFEQYLTIGGEALVLLGSAAVAIFLVCLAFTGSIWASALILLVLGMLLVDLMGAMFLAGIELNAVSLVNLVMALGIGVEFTAHLVHAFMEEEGTPNARAAAALGDVGAAVLSGITLTKLVGVSVLAFSRTAIFYDYYFKMYLALVALGAAHGLVFLPVLLTSVGPEAFDHWTLQRLRKARSPSGRRTGSEELVQTPRSPGVAPQQQCQLERGGTQWAAAAAAGGGGEEGERAVELEG